MNQENSIMESGVKSKFDSYPEYVQIQLMKIRACVLELSSDKSIGKVTEMLKWGEISYLSNNGSTIRLSWKSNKPNHVSVYFNCNTILVETFKEIYKDTFEFVGNREIVFSLDDPIPFAPLLSCISMSLRYHKIKHLPLLGA